MKRFMSIALVAFAGVAAACGDNDSTGPGAVAGNFDLTLTGAIQETADGPAWFGSDVNDEGDPVFALVLGDEDSRHLVIAGKLGSERPAVGTYDIGTAELDWDLVHFVSDDDELVGLFYGTEGVLTITESTSTRLSGTIEFIAAGLLGEEEGEVEGAIEFQARLAPGAGATLSAARALR
jgi:hypothetical protein